jgi:hypothetical protein
MIYTRLLNGAVGESAAQRIASDLGGGVIGISGID